MSRPQLREISIDQVEDPHAPARSAGGFGDLEDLAQSLREVGVIEPLIVARRESRFEVVAGHRRLLAAKIAGLVSVPCIVHDNFKAAEEAVMLHENVHRADLNVVDEARFYARLLERVDGNTDRLATLVHESRQRVEQRLLLLRGDPDVLAALEKDEIGAGVAQELNLYLDAPTRRAHLQLAAAGGAKIATVREWRKQANFFAELQATRAAAPPTDAPAEIPPSAPDPFRCFFCGSAEDVWTMEQLYIHRPCRGLLKSALGAHFREEP